MAIECPDHATFRLVSEKIYQRLKFEALPRFLLSTRFETLENNHQKLWPTPEMVWSTEEVEILTVIMEESGRRKLREYYKLTQVIGGYVCQSSLVECHSNAFQVNLTTLGMCRIKRATWRCHCGLTYIRSAKIMPKDVTKSSI